jgi:hypothetical protein
MFVYSTVESLYAVAALPRGLRLRREVPTVGTGSFFALLTFIWYRSRCVEHRQQNATNIIMYFMHLWRSVIRTFDIDCAAANHTTVLCPTRESPHTYDFYRL